MFGMGMSEMLIIAAVALLVFGPDQLPQMVKKMAKGLKEVRKASDDLKRSINLDDDDQPPRWQRPVERPPLVEPPQTATRALEAPATIPGSQLTVDEPVIVAAASAVAVGSDLSDRAEKQAEKEQETTDPQKPSSKDASKEASTLAESK